MSVPGLRSISLPIAPGSLETHKVPSCPLWGPREDEGTHPHHDIAFLLGDGSPTPSPRGGNQPPATEIALSALLIGLRTNEPSREPRLPGELCGRYRALEGDICVPGALGGCGQVPVSSESGARRGQRCLAGCGREGCTVCPRVPWDWGFLVRGRFTEGDPTSTVPTLQCGRDSPHTGSV